MPQRSKSRGRLTRGRRRHQAPGSALPRGLSVIVPAYNSAAILPDLVARLAPVLVATREPHELILVNDGSQDDTWPVIEALAASHPWVRGASMMRNYGQSNATLCGIRMARYATSITMDDDLQHPPEELPKLLAGLTDAYDVVYAPPEREQRSRFRNFSSILLKVALSTALGAETAGKASAWRVFRTQVRDAFDQYTGPFVSIDVLFTWGTKRFGAVPLRHNVRAKGASGYTFIKLLRHAFNMMTGFSVVPLQLASLIGLAFTLFGMSVLCFVVVRYLMQGTAVAGFPFLASMIAIFSGAQLFALGIMGEYLARMHFRLMDKPTYVVRSTVGGVA